MEDLYEAHSARASELIREFQTRATDILTASAGAFKAAMDALQIAHADLSTEISSLGANTETQLKSRLNETLERHKEMLAHFTGSVPLKEPIIRITAPRPDMPNVADAPPGFGERFMVEALNGEAAAEGQP